jgi:hypothetical protein
MDRVGFCQYFRRYLDFMFWISDHCPEKRQGNNLCIDERCSYYESRKPSAYYRKKLRILTKGER